MLNILVKNIPPENGFSAEPHELALFRSYIGDDTAMPYVHQSDAFSAIRRSKNTTLIAGTAAGKTLAVAIPLFCGIVERSIKKVIFLYPTIALLEDQSQVMDKLAELTGLKGEIGHLQGGMSRSRLIKELNKKIILATPDEIYWFFQKNIKYNSLLIYGLCLIDAFVLDEAHLFNGLALRNLQYFFKRIFILQNEFFSREPANLHILTATPGEGLMELNNGMEITGKSKCGDVITTFINCSPFDKTEQFEERVNGAVKEGFQKILVICNSAASAHRLFLGQRKKNKKIHFSPEHYLQFGRIRKDHLMDFLIARSVKNEIIEEFEKSINRELKYYFTDFEKVRVNIKKEEICLALKDALTKLRGQVIQSIYWAYKRRDAFESDQPSEEIKQVLRGRQHSLADFFDLLCPGGEVDYFTLKEKVAENMSRLVDEITDQVDNSGLATITYPGFVELSVFLANFSLNLKDAVLRRFAASFSFKREDIVEKKGSFRRKHSDYIYFKWLKTYFGEHAEFILPLILQEFSGSEDFRKQVEMNHVSVWGNSDYPMVLYSGSMSKQSRGGLVSLFDDLEKAILISTSAVEVGVDFAADILITEECNGSSFLQRFGRVGRTGKKSAVEVLVGGQVYGILSERLSGMREIYRENFSTIVRDLFGGKVHIEESDLVDSAHFMINKQLGLVGEQLNNFMYVEDKVHSLSKELIALEIMPAYGLRGNLPQITLKDEGVGKDPFYILQFINSRQLVASETPFEMARAEIYFNSLIYNEKFCRVGVDVYTTVENSRFLFLWYGDRYLVKKVEPARMAGLIEKLKHLKGSKYHSSSALLLYGDIYLERIYIKGEEGKQEPVTDRFDTPLIIKDQFLLVFPGRSDMGELVKMDLAGLDEVYYDIDRYGRSFNGENLILLDIVQGGCLAVYRRWLEHAN